MKKSKLPITELKIWNKGSDLVKEKFINKIKDGAIEGYKKYKILPSLTIAQAILETGWGRSSIGNNLFGIKATSNWKGKVQIVRTHEYINGKKVYVDAIFRDYDTIYDSLEDRFKLLSTQRYLKVVQAKDYKEGAKALYESGYATDPQYPNKLIQIIEQNKLHEFDREVTKVNVLLRVGSRGEDVKTLQRKLNKLGINAGTVDGIYGNNTVKAVKELQATFGLVVDGIAGRDTFNLLGKLDKIKHFKLDEFRCRHCRKLKLDINLLIKLEELRAKTGPLIINSGYRCPIHNKNVGGATNSQHLKGTAADVRSTKMNPGQVYNYADKIFSNGGVGKYNTFTHVDVRNGRSRWNG